jgi:transglutaminase/protease-like cytokinesis protein 3
MNNYGKVVIKVNKQYSNDQITYVNSEVDKIEAMMKKDLTTKDKIKVFHDYIINTTKYDKDRAGNLNAKQFKNSESHTATGLLKNHLALCGGYSDIMSIYLSRLNIPNIRISAEKHVWNLVYIDNKWLHLDATWDDPVTNTGSQILIHDYYLIDTPTLLKHDSREHNYNKQFYKEAN